MITTKASRKENEGVVRIYLYGNYTIISDKPLKFKWVIV